MFQPFLLRWFGENRFGCSRIARVISSEELGTMSKNNLRRITLVRGPIWGIHSLTLIISWLWSSERVVFQWPIIHTVYQWPFPEYFSLVVTDTRPLPELNSNNIRPSTSSSEKNWVGCVSLSVAYNRRPSSDRARKVKPTTKLKKSIKLLQVMPRMLNLKKKCSWLSY